MVPVIALVGRPNVGKSTLFNRLTRSRDAIVGDIPGLTRDRQYGEAQWEGRSYILIDTGGITGDEEGIDAKMAEQSLLAIEEADVVLFLVDARDGLCPADQMIGEHLRRRNKTTLVVVNKVDSIDENIALAEFSPLGLGESVAIAAAHGRGVMQMLGLALSSFPKDPVFDRAEFDSFVEGEVWRGFLGPMQKTALKSLSLAAPTWVSQPWLTACSVSSGWWFMTSRAPRGIVSIFPLSAMKKNTL